MFAQKPPALTDAEKKLHWNALQKQLVAIDDWQFSARVGLNIPRHPGSVSLNWTQQQHAYTLLVQGLFGQAIAEIKGGRYGVTANVTGVDKPLTASYPEQVIQAITGWSLPVSGLQYWVKGVPVPDTVANVTLNGQGQAASIFQQGWHITYTDYRDVDKVVLPYRVTLSRGDIKVRFFISHWQLS